MWVPCAVVKFLDSDSLSFCRRELLLVWVSPQSDNNVQLAKLKSMLDGAESSYAHTSWATAGAEADSTTEAMPFASSDHREDVLFASTALRPQLNAHGPTSNRYVSASTASSLKFNTFVSFHLVPNYRWFPSIFGSLWWTFQSGLWGLKHNLFLIQLNKVVLNNLQSETKIKQEDSLEDTDNGMNTSEIMDTCDSWWPFCIKFEKHWKVDPSSLNKLTDNNKWIKLETEVAAQPTLIPSAALLSAFDFTSLPAALISNLSELFQNFAFLWFLCDGMQAWYIWLLVCTKNDI